MTYFTKERTEKELHNLLLKNIVLIYDALIHSAEQLKENGFEERAEARHNLAEEIDILATFLEID